MSTQCDDILNWIRRHGSITPVQAYERFSCLALHSRCAELRERGFNVVCEIKTGNGKRWGSYSLGTDG